MDVPGDDFYFNYFCDFLIITCCKKFFLLFCNPLHNYSEFHTPKLKLTLIKYPKQSKIDIKISFFLSFVILVAFLNEKNSISVSEFSCLMLLLFQFIE